MSSKIIKIIITLLFAGSSFVVGFFVGQAYSNTSDQTELTNQSAIAKESILNEVEENLRKYVIMPEVPDQILGKILEINKDSLLVEKTPTTTHDIVWGIKTEINVFINKETKIYTFKTNQSETVKTNILPDGSVMEMPPEEFVKQSLELSDFKKDQLVTINYSLDGEKLIANEIIIR